MKYINLSDKARDLTGYVFGRLVALGPIGRRKRGEVVWQCLCNCGNLVAVRGSNLTTGKTRSCGCFCRDDKRRKGRGAIHGMAGKPLYRIWHRIIERCCVPTREKYEYYGGRGIKICDLWRQDFKAFYDFVRSLPHYGEKGYTLDRIDNNGNYEPGNVRWVTRHEQARNKRNNRMISHNGKTQCAAAWAEEIGIAADTLIARLARGWTVERSLTTPLMQGGG